MSEKPFMRRYRVVAAGVSAAVLVWLYGVFTAWTGHAAVFLVGLGVAFALLLLADWVFDLFGPMLWRLAKSLAVSVWRAVGRDPEVAALLDRHPRVGGWLRRRLTTETWTGLPLSVIVLLATCFLFGFVSIAEDVGTSEALFAYDPQIAALLRAFRTPVITRILWIATISGDVRVMLALSAVVVLGLVVWGRRAEALLFALTLAVGSAMGSFIKVVAARPRPPAAFAIINEPGSNSFPSGHALSSMLFFGLLAVVLLRSARTARERFAIVAAAGAGALAVGISRVYLGVHWPTDILASWSLAAAWLTVTVGAFLIWERWGSGPKRWPPLWTLRLRAGLTAAGVTIVALAVIGGAQADPLLNRVVSQPVSAVHAFRSAETTAFERALPRFTEKLDGAAQEPVSIVFIGTEAQLEGAFRRAGWAVADQPSITSVLHAAAAAIANQPYPTAPITPSFIGGRANDLGFEKPEGRPTVRRRHHARFWLMDVTFGGRSVWVATASLDTGVEIGSAIPLPTHHIDPDVDAERAFVVRDLTRYGGDVAETLTYRVTTPETGANAQGDPFFTDGVADVLVAR